MFVYYQVTRKKKGQWKITALNFHGNKSAMTWHDACICPEKSKSTSTTLRVILDHVNYGLNIQLYCFKVEYPTSLFCKLACNRKMYPLIHYTNRSINIGRTLIIGISQHGNDTYENGLHCMHRQPPLRSFLIAPLVISWLMQYWYAHITILFNWNVNI